MPHLDLEYIGLVPFIARLLHLPEWAYLSAYAVSLGGSLYLHRRIAADSGKWKRWMEERVTEVENKQPPMPDIFLQTDERWRNVRLGESPYFVGTPGVGYGCAVCTVANLLAQAGWDTDPGRLTAWLSANGGFTSRSYNPELPDGGSGLLYWRVPSSLFPAFHYGVHGDGRLNAEVWRADAGKGSHFQLRIGDRIVDSIGGSQSWAPARNWRKYADVSCDFAPQAPVPVQGDPYAQLVPMSGSVIVRTGNPKDRLNVRSAPDPTQDNIVAKARDGQGLLITGAIRSATDHEVYYRSFNGNYFNSNFTSVKLT